MNNFLNIKIEQLTKLSLLKLEILNNVIISMKSMIDEAIEDQTESIDVYSNVHQDHFNKIDEIDSQINTSMQTLDIDEMAIVDNILSPIKKSQQTALFEITDLNNKTILKVNNAFSEVKDQLAMIKEKKNINRSYSSYDTVQTGTIMDFKESGL